MCFTEEQWLQMNAMIMPTESPDSGIVNFLPVTVSVRVKPGATVCNGRMFDVVRDWAEI